MKLLIALMVALACAGGDLRFKPAEDGGFLFDTGVLRGTLRAGGKSVGLSSVVHIPSGITISRGMGLFSPYRVFSAGRRYGNGAWNWPSDATLRDDGSVEVRWPATEDRPFEMRAVYRWSGADTLDLETSIRPQAELRAFEVFLSSYFAEQFNNSLAYVRGEPDTGGKPGFLAAEQSRGVWQMFPRDADALALINDGRWKIPPNPVSWALMPALAAPLGLRRDAASGTTAILMAPPRDCFALATPHQTETHYSLYLSLFGRTIKAGETSRARARLVVAASPSEGDILRLYRAYR
ncbi:MAG: hypothetical protein AAB225_07195 [Acidobacteriota bacterium]